MSNKKSVEAGFIDWRTLLPAVAILVSLVAITLQLAAPEKPTDEIAEITVLIEKSEKHSEQQLEIIQELSKRVRTLEVQQEYQTTSVKMQSDRIDSLFSKLVKESASDVSSESAATSAPEAVIPATGWAVNLMSVDDKAVAEKEIERLSKLDIPAEISPVYSNNVLKYRVQIKGFSNKEAAEAYREKLATKYNIKDAWVHKP